MKRLLLGMLLLVVAGSPAPVRSQEGASISVPLSVHGGRLVVPVETADGTELSFILSTPGTAVAASRARARR